MEVDNDCTQGLETLSVIERKSNSETIKAVFCVRNEKFRLPFFLDYYRKLGVEEFYAIDNGSNDGTQEYLLEQTDVHVAYTSQSYKSSNAGRDWTSQLAEKYCKGSWCLTVDVDEFLVYPLMEVCDLKVLTAYFDQKGYEGLFSIFLDFYSDKRLSKTNYQEGESTFDVCRYFDSSSSYTCYEREIFPHFEVKGGVRQRVFWGQSDSKVGPSMRKLVLIKWKDGFAYTHSTHSCTPIRLADITGAVAHFKFLSHFKSYAKSEVDRNSRIANSIDWKVYAKKLEGEDLNLFSEKFSTRYRNSNTLLEAKMMSISLPYRNFCADSVGNRSHGLLDTEQVFRFTDLATVDYAKLIHLWSGIAMFGTDLNPDAAKLQNLSRFERDLESAVNSKLWRWSYSLRKLASKMGLTDQRTLTEQNFYNQTLHSRFTFTYKSIWWDLLGPFRVIQKIVRRLKRKSN